MLRTRNNSNSNSNKIKANGFSPMNGASAGGGAAAESRANEWEMRPGGMLVQKRTADSDRNSAMVPTIRIRVKHGSIYHEVNISSQATFGELKKMLSGPTGLHHEDQKLLFKDKERDSKAFLDITGVKDKSKLVLVEDPISQEKRFLEMRKNAKMEKAAKSISQISLEVDRLAGRVSAFDSIISKGGKVAESDVFGLIELLMNQLLKLDGIIADGDVKLQRKMQVKRVQKYVETLDMLKIKNSMPNNTGGDAPLMQQPQQKKHSNNGQSRLAPIQEHPLPMQSNGHIDLLTPIEEQEYPQPRNSNGHSPLIHRQQASGDSSSAVVVTTKWETFEAAPPLVPATSSTSSANNNSVHPRFNWEFFD